MSPRAPVTGFVQKRRPTAQLHVALIAIASVVREVKTAVSRPHLPWLGTQYFATHKECLSSLNHVFFIQNFGVK
jgi:hypothetical protein